MEQRTPTSPRLDQPRSVSARSRVEHGLRAAITENELRPGDRLSDRAICERFGASRTIVREAVRGLEAEGLLTVIPNRGAEVASLSAAEAWQIYEARAALEGIAAEGFATRASEPERAQLRAEYETLVATGIDGGYEPLLDLKRRFYGVLTEGSRNRYVAKMLDRMLNRIRQLRATSLSAPNRYPDMIRELARIVEAVERHDPEGARNAAITHVREAGNIALRILHARERENAANDCTLRRAANSAARQLRERVG